MANRVVKKTVQGPFGPEEIEVYTRWPAIMLTTITLGSGKLCAEVDQRVWIEVSANYTTWIYDGPDERNSNLLYTFEKKQAPWKFVALLEEK